MNIAITHTACCHKRCVDICHPPISCKARGKLAHDGTELLT